MLWGVQGQYISYVRYFRAVLGPLGYLTSSPGMGGIKEKHLTSG